MPSPPGVSERTRAEHGGSVRRQATGGGRGECKVTRGLSDLGSLETGGRFCLGRVGLIVPSPFLKGRT